MGLVHETATPPTPTGSCVWSTATGKVLADHRDPKPYWDYLGEAVEPWSYLKSTYWKDLGYPEGLYRVGPLARLNVIDQLGTAEADDELGAVPRPTRALPVQLLPLPLRPADRDAPRHP